MPLETEVVEILFKGLSQRTDGKVLQAGALERAENIEFTREGGITKRRGYQRYPFTGASQIAAFTATMETQAIRVATFRDELLVFGVSWLWSLGSKSASLDTRAAVRRGRLNPGNTRRRRIATAAEGA
jgi:hypothetical protein